jgi:signal transduction histidine kinase
LSDKRIKVLLVEDNPGDSRLIREMLAEARGVTFDLEYADRLQGGLEYLGEREIEAVLLDLGLPDSQGLETLSKTYAQAPEVPIVVLTGLNDELLGVEAVNRGAQDYLIKGQVDPNLLVRAILYAIERKRAEERERQLQLQLNLSNRLASLGVMAAGVAHEINNPLASVIGFAQLLMQKDIPEDTREAVKIVNDSAQQVADIIKSLHTFALQQKLDRTNINVNEIIQATLAMRTYPMEASNIRVTTQLAPRLPRTMADDGQLQQVFLNLILNAETEMKSAHGGGNLLIKTETIDSTIRISFTDDGPGIAEANLVHLFDPFFSTREVGKGTGLGLSVCHGIITEHGGTIYVNSELGKGTTFTVELPIVTEEKDMELA